MAVTFHFHKNASLKNRRKLKQFIPCIFKLEKRGLANLDIIFCDNTYILEINRNFLGHDYFTDIITFDMSEHESVETTGEIYISVDMVFENSRIFQQSFNRELHRVIFHGVLHLCGYNDKTKAEIKLMRKKENKYLEMFHGEH